MAYKFEINDLVITNRFNNAVGFIKKIDIWDNSIPYKVEYIERQNTMGNFDWFSEDCLTSINDNKEITNYSIF